MYESLTIAQYIIWYSNTIGYYINNLKLQSLLYFVQVAFLQQKLEPCFDEPIIAWVTGPIVYTIYNKYKGFGIETIFDVDSTKFNIKKSEEKISEEDKMIIKKVVSSLRNFSSTLLADVTKDQDPFKKAYVPNEKREITISSMLDYFLNEE